MKIEGARVATIENIDLPKTKGQLTPKKFELIRDVMVVLVGRSNQK